MTVEEYFGSWSNVINTSLADSTIRKLLPIRNSVCPHVSNVFKAFNLCPLESLKVIVLGQDPYPNLIDGQPVATGIAFANSSNTPKEKFSPSLKVLRDSVISFRDSVNIDNFDPSLESWERQGVLMINSALTCKIGVPSSHELLWRPFISDFLCWLSVYSPYHVYVLMGSSAQSFSDCVDHGHNRIITIRHPSWYARNNEKLPPTLWSDINDSLSAYNIKVINW